MGYEKKDQRREGNFCQTARLREKLMIFCLLYQEKGENESLEEGKGGEFPTT